MIISGLGRRAPRFVGGDKAAFDSIRLEKETFREQRSSFFFSQKSVEKGADPEKSRSAKKIGKKPLKPNF
jgi:hypothetical protein